jgi:hypothetical protein
MVHKCKGKLSHAYCITYQVVGYQVNYLSFLIEVKRLREAKAPQLGHFFVLFEINEKIELKMSRGF